jgi:hypothetical protein
MAQFVYIDETGTGAMQRYLYLVAAVVKEEQVRALANEMSEVARHHLGFLLPDNFEFHGSELASGTRHWKGKTVTERIAAYEAALGILNTCDIDIAHASIDKVALHDKYEGAYDANAYRLALQFLVEKVDRNLPSLKVLVADERHEEQLHAIAMVADMQEWGIGEAPSRRLVSIIDSLHFVRSQASPGVQMADLVAYVIQRRRLTPSEHHPAAEAAISRMQNIIWDHLRTYRQTWPG